jgi:NAD(P)H-dependent flavin oxidoreductase YrpB (nitropropane dioxygenase family)
MDVLPRVISAFAIPVKLGGAGGHERDVATMLALLR